MLALIGDQFTDENEVLGLLVNVKRYETIIQIWHKNGENADVIARVKADIESLVDSKAVGEEGLKLEHDCFTAKNLKEKQEAKDEGND